MKTIWKFPMRPAPEMAPKVLVEMPKFAKVIHAEEQNNAVCLWAEVDTNQPMEKREFYVFGTGSEMPEDPPFYYEHIGTVQLRDVMGTLVLHVYQKQIGAIGDEE